MVILQVFVKKSKLRGHVGMGMKFYIFGENRMARSSSKIELTISNTHTDRWGLL